MPDRTLTISLPADVWAALEHEAGRRGVSPADLLREAALARAAAAEPVAAGPAATVEDPLPAVREPGRLGAVRRTGLLDSATEERFDRLTRIGARALEAPVALVSLVDADRQFFKAACGLPEPWASRRETPLSYSFCQYAVANDGPLVVTDAREEPRLRELRAIEELQTVAYLGVPLHGDDGCALGTFCVLDSRPREWTKKDVDVVREIAATVEAEIRRPAV